LSSRRVHKSAAAGVSIVTITFALAPATLAAGAAGAASLPNSDIKGTPAHWSPSKLAAKARWDGVVADCGQAQGSFTIHNAKSVPENVTLTGTNGFKSRNAHGAINPLSPRGFAGICVKKGYKGTATAKLSDGKKLTITF
jgi:hypothetical protein